MKIRLTLFLLGTAVLSALGQQPDIGPSAGTRYATDAYPGFDDEKGIVAPSKKEPRWFSWFTGPKRDDASEQFAYCEELMAEENWSKAAKHYDALVRNWPTAPEAAKAQKALADVLADRIGDYEEAFAAYRYLVDFYSLGCDYDQMVDRMYEMAGKMREEGKTIVFFRFDNTVDVRRAYEACVLRAPGAKWVKDAMLTIGALREDEQKYTEAIKVYENLVNLHYGTPEAKRAVAREGAVRMIVLNDHAYNRERCVDTIDFLKLAMTRCSPEDVPQFQAWLDEAKSHLEDEAFRAAKFYDTKMRTRRSAIGAYERYLSDYPNGAHADEVRARLAELKGDEQ